MAISEKTIDTSRGRTSWIEAGAGWPVILLHAFPLNAGMWRPQLDRVPAGWRFIAPDLRGFGRSSLPEGRATMDEYAADVCAFMDGLELDGAVIGGLSMGGYVAFAMFREAPARFTGMILADTRARADTPKWREGRVALRRILADAGPRGVASEMLPKLLSPGADAATVELVRGAIESASPQALDAAIGAMMDRRDSTPELALISCATLVVAGDQDAVVQTAEAESMHRAITRSAFTLIPGAGHLSSVEQPHAFSRALGDFLLSAL